MLQRDLKALYNFGMVLPRQKIQRKCLVNHSLMKVLRVLRNWWLEGPEVEGPRNFRMD
jgi:hypothetical protein